jgi:ubiquinone/menaquinone biosynthesis C-methylase UbiE
MNVDGGAGLAMNKEKKLELNDEVREFWEQGPCGSGEVIVGDLAPRTREWFEKIETHRYQVEPFIHSVAQFSRHHGKKVLEVGVGAGTDHLQWARAGAQCFGVDLTQAAIDTTRARFAMYGFTSELQRLDAEELPFPDASFDIVYSWGVIHHSEKPEVIIKEILRVLKPGGNFVGMLYGRRSPLVFKFWVKHALLKGRPWKSFADVVWDKVESVGTKSYTVSELRSMFSGFSQTETIPLITTYDTDHWPRWISKFFPDSWGWFIGIRAKK